MSNYKQIFTNYGKLLFKNNILDELKNRGDNPYLSEHACRNSSIIRSRTDNEDLPPRIGFIKDVEWILYNPFYNRYTDKTQVFSFIRNDDVTRRALHVQLVSRIARTIGSSLGLNLNLIEAIALGHDIGHTPFGHEGEYQLNKIYHQITGKHFMHNVHSVRVLSKLTDLNISLQVLNGILCHNGEKDVESNGLTPVPIQSFDKLENIVETCILQGEIFNKTLTADTLEGCLVRYCDMIAYVMKDRQDYSKLLKKGVEFDYKGLGSNNSEFIRNASVDIINNSYGKPYIKLSKSYSEDLNSLRDENKQIYKDKLVSDNYQPLPNMFKKIYANCLNDLKFSNTSSFIYTHHINHIDRYSKDGNFAKKEKYLSEDHNDIVVDYIASMTDQYFLSLYKHLFPDDRCSIEFKDYFS